MSGRRSKKLRKLCRVVWGSPLGKALKREFGAANVNGMMSTPQRRLYQALKTEWTRTGSLAAIL